MNGWPLLFLRKHTPSLCCFGPYMWQWPGCSLSLIAHHPTIRHTPVYCSVSLFVLFLLILTTCPILPNRRRLIIFSLFLHVVETNFWLSSCEKRAHNLVFPFYTCPYYLTRDIDVHIKCYSKKCTVCLLDASQRWCKSDFLKNLKHAFLSFIFLHPCFYGTGPLLDCSFLAHRCASWNITAACRSVE